MSSSSVTKGVQIVGFFGQVPGVVSNLGLALNPGISKFSAQGLVRGKRGLSEDKVRQAERHTFEDLGLKGGDLKGLVCGTEGEMHMYLLLEFYFSLTVGAASRSQVALESCAHCTTNHKYIKSILVLLLGVSPVFHYL
ncbi:hypothetical protein KEM48_005149 [Puccinia striiformis f. sp. tritici PST-130]|nr:hypothetical protein KEM48_005149 [Puccinia striiformis f. sp. tritici PST-130]